MNYSESTILTVENLSKKFDNYIAVNNLNFHIVKGECFGLLGPNGAGKTTTVSMICTLMLPTSGSIWFDNNLLERNRTDLKRQLSLITQEYSIRKDFTVAEIMDLHGRLYGLSKNERKSRSMELLDFGGLLEHKNKIARDLSGGMKRKLMLCRALMAKPKLMLLDEPTVGMDPISRRQTWDMIRYLVDDGLSVLLTTHYIEEAQSLCGRVALMNCGNIDICAEPNKLIEKIGCFAVDVRSEHSIQCKYFKTRDEASKFVASLKQHYSLRDTTLEDVYFEHAGKRL